MDQEIVKNSYEIAFWVKEENDGSAKKILSKYEAEVTKENPIQKMKLAYPIKKENFAFFGNLIFSMDPGKIVDFKNDLNLETGLLRYFFRRAKKRQAEGSNFREDGQNPSPSKERSKSFFGFRNDSKRGTDQILTNEALEKRIEEILK